MSTVVEVREHQRSSRLKDFFRGKRTKRKRIETPPPLEEKGAGGSLFNNPQIRRAYQSLTDEERAYYKAAGEYMYGDMDGMIDPLTKQIRDSFSYISQSLKTGLHPRDLDETELDVLKECLGEEWYTHYGYEKSDVYV